MGLSEGIARIYRAWVEVEANDSGPALLVPTFAKPKTVVMGDRTLDLQLNPCPERDAFLQGCRWKTEATNFCGMFAGEITGPTSTLKPMGRGYSLDEADLKTCEIQAYSTSAPLGQVAPTAEGKGKMQPKQQARLIEVLPPGTEQIPGPSQLVVLPGARVRASQDLRGQVVRLRVTFRQAVLIDADSKFSRVRGHLVVTYCSGRPATAGDFWYVGLPHCQFNSLGDRVQLAWEPGTEELKRLIAAQA